MARSEELKEQTKILKDILKWIRVSSIKEVKEVLTTNLSDNNKKIVYHLSDGEKNIREICEMTGIKSTATISSYWNQWKKIGIVETVPAKRGERIRKIFNLEDFGIDVPNIANSKSRKISMTSKNEKINGNPAEESLKELNEES